MWPTVNFFLKDIFYKKAKEALFYSFSLGESMIVYYQYENKIRKWKYLIINIFFFFLWIVDKMDSRKVLEI